MPDASWWRGSQHLLVACPSNPLLPSPFVSPPHAFDELACHSHVRHLHIGAAVVEDATRTISACTQRLIHARGRLTQTKIQARGDTEFPQALLVRQKNRQDNEQRPI